MARMVANKPKRVIRDINIVKGSRKLIKFSKKSMRVKRGRETVNGLRKPKE